MAWKPRSCLGSWFPRLWLVWILALGALFLCSWLQRKKQEALQGQHADGTAGNGLQPRRCAPATPGRSSELPGSGPPLTCCVSWTPKHRGGAGILTWRNPESYLHPSYFLQFCQGCVCVSDEDGDHPQVPGRLQISPDVIQEHNLNPNSRDISITLIQSKTHPWETAPERHTSKREQWLFYDDNVKNYFFLHIFVYSWN